MNKTLVWRLAVLGLVVASVPIGILSYELRTAIDTDAMLDVSVSIRTISHVRTDQYGDSVWEAGNGSGFLVSKNPCHVWTNHHVIAEAAIIEVFPRRWNRAAGIPAKLVNSTPRSDVAILEIENCDGLPIAKLGNSALIVPGAETFAVGNPLGRNPDSISRGIISHTERYLIGPTPFLQTDAQINPGNSGGALFNSMGEVIGVNTALAASPGGGNSGIGYAIPINAVKEVVERLATSDPSWGTAGVEHLLTSLSPDEAEIFGVPEHYSAVVLKETPSEGSAAGKLFGHDVIYRIDGMAVADAAHAARTISAKLPGESISLSIVRDAIAREVELTLEEGWRESDELAAEYFDGHLGMTLEMWNDKEGMEGKFVQPVITKVQSLGPAHRAQISSTQSTLMVRGPMVMPYLIDVKAVTGAVFSGRYFDISTIDDLNNVTRLAFEAGAPLLLEIGLWTRENVRDPKSDLVRSDTRYFKVMPALSDAKPPEQHFSIPPHHQMADETDVGLRSVTLLGHNPIASP